MKDYYKILDLKSNATLKQIRASYKKQVVELKLNAHLNLDDNRKLAEVLEAYEILKSPLTKRKYDALIENTNSSSKRIKKKYSEQELNRYSKVVSEKSRKGILKKEKVIQKSQNRIEKEFSLGDLLCNMGELLDFILSLISAFVS